MYRARYAYQYTTHERHLQDEFMVFVKDLSIEDLEVIRFSVMNFLDEQDKKTEE